MNGYIPNCQNMGYNSFNRFKFHVQRILIPVAAFEDRFTAETKNNLMKMILLFITL